MKKSLIIGLTACFVSIVFLFQNCGEMNSSNPSSSGTDVEGNGGELNASSFEKGQAYAPELVPYSYDDKAINNALAGYLQRAGFKAIAFTEDGDLYLASSTDSKITSQQEWNRVILERCELENKGEPCSLFAEGGLIAQDRADFDVGYQSLIEVPTVIDGSKLPGVTDHWRSRHQITYPDFKEGEFKSYALGRGGAGSAGWSQESQEEATRRALQYCEALLDQGCVLYAVGMNVVFDLTNFEWAEKTIKYAPFTLTSADDIDLILEKVRRDIMVPLAARVAAGSHAVIALSRFGKYGVAESDQPITQEDRDAALAQCNAKIPAITNGGYQRKCFIYSIDDQIVMTRKDYTMATHGY